MLPTHLRKHSNEKMNHRQLLSLFLIAGVALILGATAPQSWAEDDGPSIPFADADVYAELNDTDDDLGFHALIDGEGWKELEIEDSRGRSMLDIRVKGRLRKQGLTELFFESAEPPFESDDPSEVTLTPEQFFRRFREGMYEIEGETLDGRELESVDLFRHVMPDAPREITINGEELGDHKEVDCPGGGPEVVIEGDSVTIAWDPVEDSHPDVGKQGDIEAELYQVVVEQGDLVFSAELPAEDLEFPELALPAALFEPGNVKFEILVKEAEGGNQTAAESCFTAVVSVP